MKSIFVLSFILMAANAHADLGSTLVCYSKGNLADAGYTMTFATDMKTGHLTESSQRGEIDKGIFVEERKDGREPRGGDQIQHTVYRQKGAIDGGLIFTLSTGGLAGLTEGELESFAVIRGRSVIHPVDFGSMNCFTRR